MSDDAPEAATRLNEFGQLAAGVGHNVINAFSAVVSNAELLRLASESGREINTLEIAEIIIRAAMDASGVARRLIDHSRTATTIDATSVDLHQLLAGEVERRRLAESGGVEWVADLRPVPRISGSEVQLRAMLDHLFTNALEALPLTGGRIAISSGLDERGWIVIEIRDSGAGMTSEVQERVVEPFFTTKAGHQGIGLTIAHGIWRRHHGTLAVRTQLGYGTIVRLGILPPARED